MKFWDSSAIVPLIIQEEQSKICENLLKEDSQILVWTYTATEVLSALFRKYREGKLSDQELLIPQEKLNQLESSWSEVLPKESIKLRAHRLLATHSLRSADALQLAAALVAFRDQPEEKHFITFDQNLVKAARQEGFKVI